MINFRWSSLSPSIRNQVSTQTLGGLVRGNGDSKVISVSGALHLLLPFMSLPRQPTDPFIIRSFFLQVVFSSVSLLPLFFLVSVFFSSAVVVSFCSFPTYDQHPEKDWREPLCRHAGRQMQGREVEC